MAKLTPRNGKVWEEEEEKQLVVEVQKKVPLELIAELHERTIGGIQSRLRHIAAEYHFKKNVSIEEIQKLTGLSQYEIKTAIITRENMQKRRDDKKQSNKKIQPAQPTSDSKEIISLLKDIKSLLQTLIEKIDIQ